MQRYCNLDFVKDESKVFRHIIRISAILVIPLFIIGLILLFRGPSTGSTCSGPSAIVSELTAQPRLWPESRVAYTIDPELVSLKLRMQGAMQVISDKTCIHFVEKDSSVVKETNWVNFIRDDSECVDPSTVGMSHNSNAGQPVRINVDCFTEASFQRVLGLVLGLAYEETRPDRNKYIRFLPGPECESIGNKSNQAHHPAALDLFFDYQSHMFLKPTCFTQIRLGRRTKADSTQIGTWSMGSSNDGASGGFSVLDIEKLNAMYECGGCRSYRFRPIDTVFEHASATFESFGPIVGGYDIDKEPLYICRVYHAGSLLLGKLKVNHAQHGEICWIAHEDKEFIFLKNFEILTLPAPAGPKAFVWTQIQNRDTRIPANAMIGGRTANSEPLYVARCKLSSSAGLTVIPGFVVPANEGMKVPFGDSAVVCKPFDLLLCENK